MIKFGVRVRMVTDFEDIKAITRETEKLGYDSFWLNDHMMMPTTGLAREDFMEAWTLASALSQEVSTIKLGHVVLCNSFRNPAGLAKMASTLDVISDGRLILGIGLGWKDEEYLGYGIPYPTKKVRYNQLREALEIIKLFWTEDTVNYEGKYWHIKGGINLPKPLQKPRPKILIGGVGERYTLRVVAEHADICNFTKLTAAEYQHKLTVLDKYAEEIGRDPGKIEKSWNGFIVIGNTEDEVKNRINRLKELGAPTWNFVAGTPEQVIEGLTAYTDLGVTYFTLYFFWKDLDICLQSLKLFSEQVMPHFPR